ncbi:peptidoglycan editing factor PgeF [Rhodoferax sp. GW822-FHT02A01]|uniref:peptidoglycan editing factor PgeF n=1 Tax=Rhodoferax sp. GW822-FHT02A01 TaxID=3141537 RepID=UPI00315DF235
MQSQYFDWLVPDWPAPPHVRAVCTTRQGGVSEGIYAGLNLGTHVGDEPQSVQANRQRLQEATGAHAVFLNQVHGTHVQALDCQSADGFSADAAITEHPGVACTVMVADCLPVLLCDAQGRRVLAAHAGWRGLLGAQGQGVLEQSVAAMRAGLPSRGQAGGESLLAWLGPCIGPQAFEVGNEVREAFVAQSEAAAVCFIATGPGKWLANLPALARQRLAALGIERTFGNDGSQAWCTVANPSRFFSHRRDRVSGRMAACIWRLD